MSGMEWVETTGRTIEEAKDAALDQLGVDEQDAEFEVLEEPKSGLFGRLRSEARVRARVRPTRPRPKEERRPRRRRSERPGDRGGDRGGDRSGGRTSGGEVATVDEPRAERPPRERTRQPRQRANDDGGSMGEDVPMEQQAEVAREFLAGLVERFQAQATVEVRPIDEDTVELAIVGEDLGLLIGPKGATLSAVQELARTVVQRKTGGRNGRLLVDVGGYRQARREALSRFTLQVADEVKASGRARALEPMSPADRKVVHDTVNDIDGVETTSEGEEPRRRVVILPVG
ncbi:MAG: spoIIIJ-associated protein [Actinomycetota bacterium]|jgi:spoIIIJ-associated protein